MYKTSILGIIIDDKEETFEHKCNNICTWCLDQDDLYKFLKSAILSLKMRNLFHILYNFFLFLGKEIELIFEY